MVHSVCGSEKLLGQARRSDGTKVDVYDTGLAPVPLPDGEQARFVRMVAMGRHPCGVPPRHTWWGWWTGSGSPIPTSLTLLRVFMWTDGPIFLVVKDSELRVPSGSGSVTGLVPASTLLAAARLMDPDTVYARPDEAQAKMVRLGGLLSELQYATRRWREAQESDPGSWKEQLLLDQRSRVLGELSAEFGLSSQQVDFLSLWHRRRPGICPDVGYYRDALELAEAVTC